MSETVYFKGLLKMVEKMEGETLEAQCKRLLGDAELPSYFESYQEYLLDEHDKEFVVKDDILYQVEKHKIDPDTDVFRANLNEDGNIEFDVRYYNGGCSFDDAIHEALKTIETEKVKRQKVERQKAKTEKEERQKRYRYFFSFSDNRGRVGRGTIELNRLITEISHIEDIEQMLSERYDGEKFFVTNYQLMDVFDVIPVKEKECKVIIHEFKVWTV